MHPAENSRAKDGLHPQQLHRRAWKRFLSKSITCSALAGPCGRIPLERSLIPQPRGKQSTIPPQILVHETNLGDDLLLLGTWQTNKKPGGMVVYLEVFLENPSKTGPQKGAHSKNQKIVVSWRGVPIKPLRNTGLHHL